MMIAISLAAYLAGYLTFVNVLRRAHPAWHWEPILLLCLAWPYYLLVLLASLLRHYILGYR